MLLHNTRVLQYFYPKSCLFINLQTFLFYLKICLDFIGNTVERHSRRILGREEHYREMASKRIRISKSKARAHLNNTIFDSLNMMAFMGWLFVAFFVLTTTSRTNILTLGMTTAMVLESICILEGNDSHSHLAYA